MNYKTCQLFSLVNLPTGKVNQSEVNNILEHINKDSKEQLLVFTILWDVVHLPHDSWKTITNQLENFLQRKNIKILLLLSDWLKGKIEIFHHNNLEVQYVNGIALTAYLEIFKKNKAIANDKWNPNTGKFLFLTGKWYKDNRFKLFCELEKNNLISSAVYSLFIPKKYPTNFDSYINKIITEEKYYDFYNKFNCNPDNTRTLTHGEDQGYFTHHVSAIPYDVNLYKSTSFRLISETEWNGTPNEFDDGCDPWLTEKTWIPIFNKHPFIIAGQKYTLKKLKKLGFKTFEEYLPVKNYDLLDNKQRMDAIVQNVEFWIKNIKNFQSSIESDVVHNYNNLIAYCQKDYDLLQFLIDKYKLKTNVYRLTEMTFY